MKIAFTICSNNYISQASVLAESFKKFHKEYYFAIVLVDTLSEIIDYTAIQADEILPIAELGKYNLHELFDRYDIIELNTAVKPFVFQHYKEKFKDAEVLYYFDPDLKFFTSIEYVTEQLQTASMVLTPHILEPIPRDGGNPTDQDFLNYGLYNLGFLGLNPRHSDIPALLTWWSDRTFHLGYNQVAKGLFVDQLWMNLAPLFYKESVISFDRGLNMGPWNLHERRVVSIDNDKILLSSGDTLKFYHFSSFRFRNPTEIAHTSRFTIDNIGELKQLYADYFKDLQRHKMAEYSQIRCAYVKPAVVESGADLVKRKIRTVLKKVVNSVLQ